LVKLPGLCGSIAAEIDHIATHLVVDVKTKRA
jgi:hypothetical protein